MAQQVSQGLAVPLTPFQVKLCPYDEEEPAIWFYLIEAQFAAAGIDLKRLIMAMPSPTCPNNSTGTFWIQSMPATSPITVLVISRLFCWGNLARVSGNPILNC
jgi:hypothetical protein